MAGGFPSQGPVTRSFDVFFDLRLIKRLEKQSRRRWFQTPSGTLWRHCNGPYTLSKIVTGFFNSFLEHWHVNTSRQSTVCVHQVVWIGSQSHIPLLYRQPWLQWRMDEQSIQVRQNEWWYRLWKWLPLPGEGEMILSGPAAMDLLPDT